MSNLTKDYEEVTLTGARSQAAFSALMRKLYSWMMLALVVTGLTAYYVASNENLLYSIFGANPALVWGLFIGEIVLVLILSAAINKLSFMAASLMFIAYSVLNGVTMSVIFIAYTESSIVSTFFITAATFGAMSLYGYYTKSDLTSIGKYLFMALIGLVIATLVNLIIGSTGLQMIISYIGVLIFVGLTAYDTQKIKNMFIEYGNEVNEGTQKLAILGSLTLYLDFINLFLYLLRILGSRR